MGNKRTGQKSFGIKKVCRALRSTDIVRLPIPEPAYEKDVARELLLDGTYPNSAAVKVAEDFQLRLKLLP